MAARPHTELIVGSLFLGLLTSVFWPLTQHVITMAHEGGHATVGSMTGGRVEHVKLRANGEGVTRVPGSNLLLTAMVGYVGPSVFGILGAWILAYGVAPDAIIWVSLAMFVVLFLQIRNLFGWLAVLSFGVVFYLVGRYGTPGGRTVFAYTWVWFLLFGGFLHTAIDNVKMAGLRFWSSDAAALREIYKLPRGFWGMLWWLATLAALVYGGGVLFGVIHPPLGHR